MIQRTEAQRLSSMKEWSLISSSLPPALAALSVARLKSKIVRARNFRQKYQDLYRRQKLSSKPRMTGRPDERLNVRTLRKKQMFDEALGRLKMQLREVSAPMKTPSAPRRKRARTVTPSRSSRVGQIKTARRRQSLSDRAASSTFPKTARLRAAGYTRRHTHVVASGGRRQSRRDSTSRNR